MNNAKLYVKSSSLQQQLVSMVLQEVWPSLEWRCGQGTVLDVGCGPGDVTALELLRRLPPEVSVLAVDINPKMIAMAADRYSGPRLRYAQLDIATPNVEDSGVWRLGPFAKVFSFFCLHWVKEQRLALQNINKLLCPGGETVLIQVTSAPLYVMLETLAKSSRWGAYMEDYRQFEPPYRHSTDPADELRKYLLEIGFSVKICRNEDVNYSSMDEQLVTNTLTAINPFVGRVPQPLRGAYLRDCVAEAYTSGAIVARRLPGGTAYCLPYRALVAHAVRP